MKKFKVTRTVVETGPAGGFSRETVEEQVKTSWKYWTEKMFPSVPAGYSVESSVVVEEVEG